MTVFSSDLTVTEVFFPLRGLAAASLYARPCREFFDEDYVLLGVHRVLESSESGRAFLQEHGLHFEKTPGYFCYFDALQSQRRWTSWKMLPLSFWPRPMPS